MTEIGASRSPNMKVGTWQNRRGTRRSSFAAVLGLLCSVGACLPITGVGSVFDPNLPAEELAAYQQAAEYSRAQRGVSMVIMKGGRVVFEDYPFGHSADEAHDIYSGTKSFSAAMAVAAAADGLLALDELVSQTITEWQADESQAQLTIRQLLTLTGGIDAGDMGSPPGESYSVAVAQPLLHAPGTAFQYGPAPFQVFGELLRRKLAPTGENARDYLQRRVLQPIGLHVKAWKDGADGNPKMAGGAVLTTREWAKYGQLLLNGGQWDGRQILDPKLLAECFQGTAVNPAYGLAFWLPVHAGLGSENESNAKGVAALQAIHAPSDLIKAAGVYGQKMYIVPSLNLVIVRQAPGPWLRKYDFSDAEFLAPIFGANPEPAQLP